MLLWGGWLVVTAIVFSFGSGVIHTYYTVALAPAIAALAIGVAALWHDRQMLRTRVLLATGLIITAGWSWILLDRTAHWESWGRALIRVSAALAVAGLLAAPLMRRVGHWAWVAIAALAVVACLSGPIA
jgi:4-amino-4-deoxy-L-arabinose transferase-like glycosyltransferase